MQLFLGFHRYALIFIIICSDEKRSYLRVAVTGSGTCAGVLTSTGCIDETNWLDVIVIAETAADCQYHIIVVDCSRIVTWVSSLRSTTFGLSLSRSGSRTSSSCPCICTLFAMSCAHYLKILSHHTVRKQAARVRPGASDDP